MTLAIVVLIAALFTAATRAAHGLAVLMSQFLRLAAAVTSVFLVTLISMALMIALLIHR